jgi:CubicO group peptidase (beta-lactamase class C family)
MWVRVGCVAFVSLASCAGSTERVNRDRTSDLEQRATPPLPAPSASQSIPQGEVLDEDRELTTEFGHTFRAPARFSHQRTGAVTKLVAPEGDLTLTLVETEALGGAAAIAAAWTKAGTVRTRPVLTARGYPAKHGFDAGHDVEYATTPNERMMVLATARGRGNQWVVTLIEGSNSTIERRFAAVTLVRTSLRAKGYVPETFARKPANILDAARLAEIAAFVEEARRGAELPGVGFGLLQAGKVVLARGFGVRELGKPATVDEHTLFPIASNTKALTTLLLAVLVDEGKLAWGTPVSKVFPSFGLGDAATTEKVQLRHLICACTGLPRKDWKVFFDFGRTQPKDVFTDLARAQPTTGFGETYQYNNFLAAAAGYVAGHAAFPGRELGAAYDAALRRRVLEPLGMTETTFDVSTALKRNHAAPHGQDFRGAQSLASNELLPMLMPWRPTGAAWSSTRDMLRYLALELSGGVLPNGKRLVSEANLLERRRKQISMGENVHYGMGLRVRTDWGTPVVFHGGIRAGYASQMFLLPEHGVAGVILTNADSGWFVRDPIIRRVAEVLFDGQPEAAADLAAGIEENRSWIQKERADLVLPAEASAVAALAERYQHAELGDVTVQRSETGAVFDFGEWSTAVASRRNSDGTVTFVTVDPGELYVEFHAGTSEGRRTLVTRELQHEYVLTEVR